MAGQGCGMVRCLGLHCWTCHVSTNRSPAKLCLCLSILGRGHTCSWCSGVRVSLKRELCANVFKSCGLLCPCAAGVSQRWVRQPALIPEHCASPFPHPHPAGMPAAQQNLLGLWVHLWPDLNSEEQGPKIYSGGRKVGVFSLVCSLVLKSMARWAVPASRCFTLLLSSWPRLGLHRSILH